MTYTLLWVGWIVAFGLIEGAALTNTRPGDTLSESFWRWFSVKDKGRGYRVRRTLLLAFLAWLVVHLLSGGAYAQPMASGTCAWTQDAIDPRRYDLTGFTCPIAGHLIVYTHLGVDGAGAEIPATEPVFSVGTIGPGDRVGLWAPEP